MSCLHDRDASEMHFMTQFESGLTCNCQSQTNLTLSRCKFACPVQPGSTRECVLRCSFLEIYNEVLADLLNPESTHLQIREDVKLGIYVEHLSEHVVTSRER